jgi:hypothetical protein
VGRMRGAAARSAILSRSQAAYSVVSSLESFIAGRAAARPKPSTTIESLFTPRPPLTPEHRKAWSIAQYQKYLRAISLVARDNGVLSAHFIQPVPAIDKPLSEDEKKVVGDLKYGPLYSEMTTALVGPGEKGIPIISLLDVFHGDTRTLYGDPIHMQQEMGTGRSSGYERMADRMSQELAKLWRLQPR